MSIRHDPIKSRLSRSSTIFLLLFGAAVGFSNIWKFPILVGQYGGGAFLLVYLFFMLLLGVPLMMAELGLGRTAARNPIDTVAIFCKQSDVSYGWKVIGWFAVAASLVVLSFYSVIGGMGMAYIFYSAFGEFNGVSLSAVNDTIVGLRQSPIVLIVWHTFFLLIVSVIVSRGVRNGIGRAARMLVPIMVLLLVMMLIHASSMEAFSKSYDYLFQFSPEKLTIRGVLEALSHSFFTLTIGLGAIMAFGAYMPDRMSIPWTALGVALADLFVALAAGLIILTLIFTYNQQPQQGFALLFQSIPWLFGKESMGQFWGAAFFVLLTFAAWTSAIALSEPFVVWMIEKTSCSRRFASIILALVAWTLGGVVIFSLNEWKDLRVAGLTLFGFMDFLTSRFLIPVGGLLLALFVGVRIKKVYAQESVGFKYQWMFVIWYFNIRWLVPGAILLVFVFGILKFTESACRTEPDKKNFLCAVMALPAHGQPDTAQRPQEKAMVNKLSDPVAHSETADQEEKPESVEPHTASKDEKSMIQ